MGRFQTKNSYHEVAKSLTLDKPDKHELYMSQNQCWAIIIFKTKPIQVSAWVYGIIIIVGEHFKNAPPIHISLHTKFKYSPHFYTWDLKKHLFITMT
jgi:hypothetical protein